MPLFFFDIENGEHRPDPEGAELPDVAVARAFASGLLSTIEADQNQELRHRVMIRDQEGKTVAVVWE